MPVKHQAAPLNAHAKVVYSLLLFAIVSSDVDNVNGVE